MQDAIDASPLHIWTEHCRRGELAYQVCTDDGAPVFHPRVVAPRSGSRNLEWRVSGGRGAVYAATAVFSKGEAPYSLALIDLDEGFRMLSRVEDVAAEDVVIGMRVSVRFRSDGADAPPYPVFVPEEKRP